MAVRPVVITVRRRERLFYVSMAVLIAITVFAGFSRTYFLKAHFGTPPLSALLHLHGLVFTSWILLFLGQTTLVAARRTDIHRRLGVFGGLLALLMIVLGTATAILRVKGGAAPIPGVSGLSFLAIPLFDMVVFTALVGAAFYHRHRADVHKRLMTLATISLLAAPIARLPLPILRAGPPAFFGLADLFILALLVYDLATRRRVHPATIWGGLLIVASQPLRLMISGTSAWLAFATWLTQ
ncbi:MAG TPA: hypothetical protein VGJ36_04145 [Gemmatimonadales bacterium]|jgi:hypothetical protein